jgi:hypothetical protein
MASGSDDDEATSPSRLEAAERRLGWLESNDRVAYLGLIRKSLIIGIPALLMSGAIVGVAFSYWSNVGYASSDTWLKEAPVNLIGGSGLGLAVGAYLAPLWLVSARNVARRRFYDRVLVADARENLREAEEKISEGSVEFSALWDATQKRLDYYHQIATSQSRRSFANGQLAAGVGLLVVIITAVVAGASRSTAGAISAAVLGVSGGGLAGFIGSTFLRSQESASVQMRQYFAQPLEFSKVLAAERLLAELDPKAKSDATVAIIRSMLSNESGQTPPKPAQRRQRADVTPPADASTP